MHSECIQAQCGCLGLEQLNLVHPSGIDQRYSEEPLRFLADTASAPIWSRAAGGQQHDLFMM